MSGCRFCEIVEGSRSARFVHENRHVVAFLDARPVFAGHTLVVPRLHYETLADLPDDLVRPLFLSARLLSVAVKEALSADGTFVAMNNTVSQSVPHLHVHVVPRRKGDGLKGFFWPRHAYSSEEEADRVQDEVKLALERVSSRAAAGEQTGSAEAQSGFGNETQEAS